MTEQRITSLESKVGTLTSDIAKLVAKMDAYTNDRAGHEKTLHNIDENVRALALQVTAAAGERHKETANLLHPLWDVVRKHDSRFHECGIAIKDELRKEARSHIALIWFGAVALAALAAYTYDNDKKDMKKDIYSVIEHIDKHHQNATSTDHGSTTSILRRPEINGTR